MATRHISRTINVLALSGVVVYLSAVALVPGWFGPEPSLGPSGAPQSDPFGLTPEYVADFHRADICPGAPADLAQVRMGEVAIYGVGPDGVTVFLDEMARRLMLDYCEV